jgi:hypothetical protein
MHPSGPDGMLLVFAIHIVNTGVETFMGSKRLGCNIRTIRSNIGGLMGRKGKRYKSVFVDFRIVGV